MYIILMKVVGLKRFSCILKTFYIYMTTFSKRFMFTHLQKQPKTLYVNIMFARTVFGNVTWLVKSTCEESDEVQLAASRLCLWNLPSMYDVSLILVVM